MAETKTKTAAKKKPAARGGAKKPAKRPIRREVGGVCTLILALCVGVGYFSREKAILIDWLSVLLKGLFGYAYWLMLGVLLLVSWILLLHRGRPVRLCVVSALLVPLFAGALWHEAFCKTAFDSSLGVVKLLWQSGGGLASGGVLGGALAIGFHAVLGQVASLVVFTILLLTALLTALRLTPAEMKRRWDARERLEYPEETQPAQAALPEKRDAKPAPAAKAPFPYDVPVDGQPIGAPAGGKPAEKPAEKNGGIFGGFFRQKPSHIRTPDEYLAGAPAAKGESPAAADGLNAAAAAAAVAAGERPAVGEPLSPAPEKDRKKSAFDRAAQEAEAARVAREIAARPPEETYEFPPITLLNESRAPSTPSADAELRNNARRLAETLRSFGVEAAPGDVIRGPSVTRYEFILEQGVKLSKVTNLADDIALALGASGVRIAPIPNKLSVVGVEVPNKTVAVVSIREIIESRAFVEHRSRVCFAVGKDIGGSQIVGDIAKLPHILIAGTTGSGKSVCTNSLIVSLMYKSSPEDVKFIMVDPKMVELAPYNGIPHLLIPVVTDPKKAAGALQWAVFEMMKRYKIFSEHGVKDLRGYNAMAEVDGTLERLPSVVVVIDELADLMLVAAKEVEESICRVAQMGRAAGMHLVIATQRPSADVITGLMKANIPSRIAFAVASSLESRIILDTQGAEKLVGRGDMLYAPLGEGKPRRVQGCMITAEEIERVVAFVKQNSGEAQYSEEVMEKIEQAVAEKEKGGKAPGADEPVPEDDADELLPAAVEVLLETGQASVSMLQRRLKLGYSRAARLVDQMEERGIVGPFEGSKPRQLLITRAKWQEMQMAGKTEAPEGYDLALSEADDFSRLRENEDDGSR